MKKVYRKSTKDFNKTFRRLSMIVVIVVTTGDMRLLLPTPPGEGNDFRLSLVNLRQLSQGRVEDDYFFRLLC